MAIENANFSFLDFFFWTLEDFSEKTYEKTCCFYNIFLEYYSNCARLPNFTLWIFFSKICWLFQFNVHIFRFPPLARKLMKRPTNFMTYFQTSHRYLHAHKIWQSEFFFFNKMAALSNNLFISVTLSNILSH